MFCFSPGLPALAASLLLALPGCRTPPPPHHASPQPRPDINVVLRAHDRQLMAIPGVVGVYVGLLPDGETLCLKVMLARPNPQLQARIPHHLDGYPVVTEVTGEIRPLGQ